MVDNIKQQLNVLSNALRVRNQKQEILASNIANAATPNYKARDVEFEVELITPIAMDKELRFAIREGGHTVGAGVVTEINE